MLPSLRCPRRAGASLAPDRHASRAAEPSRPRFCHGAGCSHQSDGDRPSTETHGCLLRVGDRSGSSAACLWVCVWAPPDASPPARSWRSAFGRGSAGWTWRIVAAVQAASCGASCTTRTISLESVVASPTQELASGNQEFATSLVWVQLASVKHSVELVATQTGDETQNIPRCDCGERAHVVDRPRAWESNGSDGILSHWRPLHSCLGAGIATGPSQVQLRRAAFLLSWRCSVVEHDNSVDAVAPDRSTQRPSRSRVREPTPLLNIQLKLDGCPSPLPFCATNR